MPEPDQAPPVEAHSPQGMVRTPGTLRTRDAQAPASPTGGLDQSTSCGLDTAARSLIYDPWCLNGVDRFRFNSPADMPVSAWLPYVRVPDAQVTAAKVAERGGTILNGPMEVPGGDLITQCRDPQGAAFAVHSTKGE